MALSLLYLVFVCVLQLFQLSWRKQDQLAVELVMLRHEGAVRRRQAQRSTLQPTDRAVLAGLWRLPARTRQSRFFVQPTTEPTSSAGSPTSTDSSHELGGRVFGTHRLGLSIFSISAILGI
jgi:hypothetical protein